MINKLFEYVNDKKLKIIYLDNVLNIINYNKVLVTDDSKIKLDCFKKMVTIKGNSLFITKLCNDEIIIKGKINEVIMEDNE